MKKNKFPLRWELLEDRIQPTGGGFANAGLMGEYFNSPDLSGDPAFTRRDLRIDFDWGTNLSPGGSISPAFSSIGTDHYSIRWSGTLIPRFSENYIFEAIADDGVRVLIKPEGSTNYTALIDQWHTAGTFTGTMALTANERYDIRIEYREATGPAKIQLYWQSRNTPREIIESPNGNGYIVNSREIFMVADATLTARATWYGIGDGPAPITDSKGWPMGDGRIVVWEGANDFYFSGTYNARFTGRANISGIYSGINGVRFKIPGNSTLFDYLTYQQVWDPVTNISEFQLVVANDYLNSPFAIQLTDTRRLPTDTTQTGITNLHIMRPQTIGGDDPYPYGTLFRTDFIEAASVFTHFRYLDTNGNLSEREWSDRVKPEWNRVASPGNPDVVNKNWTYEYQILFANESGRDLYLTIPMRASNDYFYQLAKLLRYGSHADGTPCSGPNDPLRVYPGLNPNLKAYIEVSNEVWNYSGGFEQTRQADDDAVAASQAPAGSPLRAEWDIINYDGVLSTSDSGGFWSFDMQRLNRWYALRTVRMSEAFRSVYGEAMLDSARPLLFWQYDNNNQTALNSLKFIDEYFNNIGGNYVATPRPVNYFLWGAGGASYYGSTNPQGRLQADPVTNPSFDVTQGLPLNTATVRPMSVTGWNFSGNAGVYGRAPSPSANYISDGREMLEVPNPGDGDYAAYLMRQTSGDASMISRTIHIAEPGRYALGFTLRYRDGWQYRVPLDFFLDGERVTPQYYNYRGVGEADPATRPMEIGWSWNLNTGSQWTSQLTTATVQINVPTGGRSVTFTVSAENITTQPGHWDYQYQIESYALFDGFYLGSVDRVFEAGMPESGEANGLVSNGAWASERRQIAHYAHSYGLKAASYEAGFSLGGDWGASPLQNWLKYRDPRTKLVNNKAIDVHDQAGYALVSWGVYEQWRDWDLANAANAPLRQSFDFMNQSLPHEATNGLSVPLALNPVQHTLGYQNLWGTYSGFTRNANAFLSPGQFLAWNILVPTQGEYMVTAITNGGTYRLTIDEAPLTVNGTQHLTPGLHSIKLRSLSEIVNVERVIVEAVNAPPAPTLISANDGDGTVSLSWTSVPGAVGYIIRYGTSPNNYSLSINAGMSTHRLISGLTNNTSYYFTISAVNSNGMSLPSNEIAAIPLADGQVGNLAVWEFTGIKAHQTSVDATAATSRIIVGSLTRGSGMLPTSQPSENIVTNRFSSYTPNWAQTLSGAIAQEQYLQFSLTATQINAIVLQSLDIKTWFYYPTDNSGIGVRISSDGINFTDLITTGAINASEGHSTDLAGMQLENETVIVRIYYYGTLNYTPTGIGLGTPDFDLVVRGSVQSGPQVSGIVVNDGASQRSTINSLNVQFNTVVNLGANAFELRSLLSSEIIPATWSTQIVDGRTLAIISAMVPDGNWRLTTVANQIAQQGSGTTMDANHTYDFHRLFGDINGDGTVDSWDFADFGSQFGLTSYGNPFDYNSDNTIDATDFAAFGSRFGMTI